MMLPIAAYAAADDALMLGPGDTVTAGAFFDRAAELAAALPAARHVINLSETRLGFMLGFAAALMRGQASLLPPGQGPGDWQQLLQQYPDALVIADRTIEGAASFDLRAWLVMDSSPRTLRIPQIRGDLAAAVLFTSGSTGQPTAHAKSWRQLSAGARCLAHALGWQTPNLRAVIGSVPPQHMFGLEATVMLPWLSATPVHALRPLLPADLETAIEQCARPCWWMTTPVHLRPALQASVPLDRLAGIVASTMSLPPAVARDAEIRWNVPVVEIYGSTETGALAARRTAKDSLWTPLEGVRVSVQGPEGARQVLATGSHIDVPVVLGDELCIGEDGRFTWLGRSADMLKIAGKRTSLAALNQTITTIAGVDDAVFFTPDTGAGAASHDDAHPAQRLAAFYVSSSLSPTQMQAALRARVDPVFVPRPLFRVTSLPRNATGKIPHAALAALFEQLNNPGGGSQARSPQTHIVPAGHPALSGHFPGNPIVPGAMIIAQIAEDVRLQLPGIELGRLLSMRFHAPLRPGQAFAVHATLHDDRVIVEVRKMSAGEADIVLASGQWAVEAATEGSNEP